MLHVGLTEKILGTETEATHFKTGGGRKTAKYSVDGESEMVETSTGSKFLETHKHTKFRGYLFSAQ